MHQENTFTLSSEYKDILDQEFSTGFGDVTERLLSGNGTDADQLVVHNLLHDTQQNWQNFMLNYQARFFLLSCIASKSIKQEDFQRFVRAFDCFSEVNRFNKLKDVKSCQTEPEAFQLFTRVLGADFTNMLRNFMQCSNEEFRGLLSQVEYRRNIFRDCSIGISASTHALPTAEDIEKMLNESRIYSYYNKICRSSQKRSRIASRCFSFLEYVESMDQSLGPQVKPPPEIERFINDVFEFFSLSERNENHDNQEDN